MNTRQVRAGQGKTRNRHRMLFGVLGWMVLFSLIFATPTIAADMLSNGGFDGATSWTFGGNGSYSTAQNNGILIGAGSFEATVTGRNATLNATVSQAVSVVSGAEINSVSLSGMNSWGLVSPDPVTVTVAIRYADATTVNIFSANVPLNSSWADLTNDLAGTLPLTTAQNVNTLTVTVTGKNGNNASATQSTFIDDIVIDYAASATDSLTVTSSVNVSTTAQPGQIDTQMMYMQLNSDATGNGNCVVTDVTLNDVYVTLTGTIAGVQVHLDDNSNFLDGTLGSNTVTTWNGASTLVDLTAVDLTALERTVTAGTPKFIWILYDIEAGSSTGIQVQVQITDVSVVAPDIAPSSGPWESNMVDINTGLGCGDCHPNPMLDGVSRNPATGGVVGDHTKHATAQGYDCELCHLATPPTARHRNTFIEMRPAVGDVTNARYDKDGDHAHDSSWEQATVPNRGRCENTNCHGGLNSLGDYGGPTGTGPQWGTINADTCTFCHNANQTNAGGVANAYPSIASSFRSSADAGAHAVHMAGSSGLINGGVACADCHTVPAAINDAGHMDELGVAPYTEAPADVPFPAGSPAELNSTTPAYNDVATTCTAYCHGANMPGGDTSGINQTPAWSDDWTNYSTGCTDACHGLPPTAGTSAATHSGQAFPASCTGCHADTVTDTNNPPTMVASFHINGTVEASGCTGCHGTDPKQYPPASATATTGSDDAIGAHVVHIESTSALMSKENIEGTLVNDWCAECHTTTRGAGGHDGAYPAEVEFTDAVESAYGSVTEAFTADGTIDDGIAGSCVTYCHTAFEGVANTAGTNTQPKWSDDWSNYEVDSACSTACHLTPPTTSSHSSVTANDLTACNTCHADTVTDTSALPTIGTAFHINGVVDATGCTGCHGSDPNEYPPVSKWGADTATANGVGAHVTHIENTASFMSKEDISGGTLVYDWCAECHTTTRGAGGHDDGYPAEIALSNAVESNYTGADGGVAYGFTSEDADPDTGSGGTCLVYCHGADMPNMGTGGNGDNTNPAWGDSSTGCSFCHGVPPNSSGHGGSETLTQCSGCHPDTVDGAGAISNVDNHINGTIQVTASCTGCHNGGGPGAKLVSENSTHSNVAMNTATGGAISTCEDCHFDDHSSRGTGTVDIPWDTRTMGTITASEDALDSIIYIKGSGSEAEVCWGCHATYGISEWNSTAGSGPRPAGYLSSGGPNWIGATWDSANFTYKQGPIASVHETQESTANPAVVSDDTDHAASPDGGQDAVADISCSACHDVHSIADGDTDAEPAPYLRGTWTTNPFPEDGAPQTTAHATVWGGVPRAGLGGTKTGATPNVLGGWQIEQNNPGAYTQVSSYTLHSGLCASCHDQTGLEGLAWTGHGAAVDGFGGGGSNIFRTSFRGGTGDSQVRGHMQQNNSPNSTSTKYVLGLRSEYYGADYQPSITVGSDPQYGSNIDETWGLSIDDGTTDPDFHQFACSKCHDPHASRLPRLMITNCLDIVQNVWDDTNADDPSTWQGANGSTIGAHNAKQLSYSSTAVNCHRYVDAAATGNEETPGTDEPGWNLITPW